VYVYKDEWNGECVFWCGSEKGKAYGYMGAVSKPSLKKEKPRHPGFPRGPPPWY
jgi:hypothetical protein